MHQPILCPTVTSKHGVRFPLATGRAILSVWVFSWHSYLPLMDFAAGFAFDGPRSVLLHNFKPLLS